MLGCIKEYTRNFLKFVLFLARASDSHSFGRGNMSFKYLQLAAALQAEIVQGAFPDKLPTEKELTERYQVSRQTVRQALERLVELGLIEKRQGSGSRVLPQTLSLPKGN